MSLISVKLEVSRMFLNYLKNELNLGKEKKSINDLNKKTTAKKEF